MYPPRNPTTSSSRRCGCGSQCASSTVSTPIANDPETLIVRVAQGNCGPAHRLVQRPARTGRHPGRAPPHRQDHHPDPRLPAASHPSPSPVFSNDPGRRSGIPRSIVDEGIVARRSLTTRNERRLALNRPGRFPRTNRHDRGRVTRPHENSEAGLHDCSGVASCFQSKANTSSDVLSSRNRSSPRAVARFHRNETN